MGGGGPRTREDDERVARELEMMEARRKRKAQAEDKKQKPAANVEGKPTQ